MGNLTTLDRALQWLQQTSDPQDLVARLITAVSTQVQNWLGYQVMRASHARTFNGEGTRKLYVPDLPLISVQSLVIDAMPIPAGVISGNAQQAGYYNDAQCIGLIGYCFTRGFQNIVVDYTAGFSVIPSDIEQAALDWIKISWSNQQVMGIGTNVTAIQAGDTQIHFGGKGSVTDVTLVPMPSTVYAALLPYQRRAMVSGF